MVSPLEAHFTGSAVRALSTFYADLPSVPRTVWPGLLHGMGYNFEYYDALFAMVLSNVQLSMTEGAYTPRYEAVQAALVPFCSEFGIEVNAALARPHRALYAEFFERATGQAMPERYPTGDSNPWLAASRRWTAKMRGRLEASGDRDRREGQGDVDHARFCLAYLWAIEHLSVDEFRLMRAAWEKAGVRAPYLDAHVAVEAEHEDFATRAVRAFGKIDDPLVARAVRAHEEDLSGYYVELSRVVVASRARGGAALERDGGRAGH